MKTTIKFSGSLALLALLSFSACGGGGGSSSNDVTPAQSSATDVTVERGKVYNATVTDSSTPPQTAKEKANLNVYTFAKKPTYPISATGGWIDVNGDGKKDAKDVDLDITLKSYSDIVTPVTTYIADANKTIRENRLKGLTDRLNAPGVGVSATVSDADLLGVASKAQNLDFVFLVNAIYKDIKENGGNLKNSDEDSILIQFTAVRGLTLSRNPGAIEAAVMSNLVGAGFASYIPQSELPDENTTSGTSTVTHDFQEATSVDISSGLPAHSSINLFKNDDANTEIHFTLTKDKSIIQYMRNYQAVWQNTHYQCSTSGNTITCNSEDHTLDLALGSEPAPSQVILELGSSTVTAHVSATMNGAAYTVFNAMDMSFLY